MEVIELHIPVRLYVVLIDCKLDLCPSGALSYNGEVRKLIVGLTVGRG